MFNYLKKSAKDISWTILRQSQRFMLDSRLAADERIDPRHYMVGIGAGALLKIICGTDVVRPNERKRFLNYIFSYANDDIYSLLMEFCLEPLPQGAFKECYELFYNNYLRSIELGDDAIYSSLITLIFYSVKEEFFDEECLDSIISIYEDDLAVIEQYYRDIHS